MLQGLEALGRVLLSLSRPAGCRRHPEALVGPSAGRWLRPSTWALTTTWGILRSRLPGSDHATGDSESPALLRACLACCLSSCLSGKGHLSEEISSTAVYSLNTYFVAGPVQGWREDAGPPGSPRTRAHTHTPPHPSASSLTAGRTSETGRAPGAAPLLV